MAIMGGMVFAVHGRQEFILARIGLLTELEVSKGTDVPRLLCNFN